MAFVHVLATGEVAAPAFYATETLANAAVATNGGSVVNLTTVPDIVEPGVWYDATAQTFSLAPPAQNDTERLRITVRNTHQQLFAWKDSVDREAALHPAAAVALAHDFLAWAHYGIYLMVHNHRTTGNADWTLDQRVTATQRMAMGAADITNAYEFFTTVEVDSFVGPSGPVLWVNVDTGDRVNLDQAINNTNNMNLDSTQLPNSSILHGSWINTLTT